MCLQIASDWNKPNGQMCIGGDRGEILRFLHDLPVRKVCGSPACFPSYPFLFALILVFVMLGVQLPRPLVGRIHTTRVISEYTPRTQCLKKSHVSPCVFVQIGGVGKVTEKCLREAMGVVTCGDLFRERASCLQVMTPRTSKWLIKVRLPRPTRVYDKRKGICSMQGSRVRATVV